MLDPIDLAIQKTEQGLTIPPVPTEPAVDVLIDTDVSLNEQRKIAKAQDTEVETANKKLEALQSEVLLAKALSFVPLLPLPPVPAAVLAALSLLKKARSANQDKKLKAKKDLAKKQKEVTEQRQASTRKNIQRGAETYKYPLTPQPTPTPVELSTSPPAPTPTVSNPFGSPLPPKPVKYFTEFVGTKRSNRALVLFSLIGIGDKYFPDDPIMLSNRSFQGNTESIKQQVVNLLRTEGYEGDPPQPDFVWPGK